MSRRTHAGTRVLVLRAGAGPSRVTVALREALDPARWSIDEVPTLAFEWSDPAVLRSALASIASDDWVVFTSANAARAVADAGLAAQVQRAQRVAAAGRVTAEVVAERLGIADVFVPETFIAESLADGLIGLGAAGRTVWLPRAEVAREVLPTALRAAGATVHTVPAYRAVVAEPSRAVLAAHPWRDTAFIVVCSSRTLVALDALAAPEQQSALRDLPIASIGPITSATARRLGYTVMVEPPESTMDALARTTSAWLMTGEGA